MHRSSKELKRRRQRYIGITIGRNRLWQKRNDKKISRKHCEYEPGSAAMLAPEDSNACNEGHAEERDNEPNMPSLV